MANIKKFFKKKKIIVTFIIIILFFAGKYYFVDSKKSASESAVAKREDIKETLTLSGEIDADDHVTLSFGVSGRTNWVGVREGDWVKEGQGLASIDAETLNAVLRQAWQSFTSAKAASDKYYDGRDSNAAESYDDKITRTALDAAQNVAFDNIRIAQENLRNAVLYSPIEGLVVSANPKLVGVNITPLNSAYEVVNPSAVYLKVTADQTEVGSIKVGQKGIMIFDSYPDEEIKGVIKDIYFTPAKNETGTVYDVKVELSNIDNSSYKYRLGMTADADFVIKENKNTIIIPNQYVNADDKGRFVLVGKNKEKRYVTIGIENEQDTEIIKGLSEGEVVYSL